MPPQSAVAVPESVTTVAGRRPETADRPTQTLLSRWMPRVLVAAFFVAVSAAISGPVLAHLGSAVPGANDGVLFSWYFEWVAQCVVHAHNPFVSSALNAPTGVNVMWNTAVLLLATVCTPLTLIIGPFATVSLVNVFAPAVSGIVCYAVLRRLCGGVAGPLLGGLLYAYGPFMFGQWGHVHLLFAPFPPLLLLLAHRLLTRPDASALRTGVWLGVLTGVQLLVAEEIVALTALVAAAALVWLVVVYPHEVRPRVRRVVIGLAAGIPIALVICAVPLWYQFFGPNALRRFRTTTMRADVASFVRPSVLQYYASTADIRANLHFPSGANENTGYLGWPLVLAVFGVCAWAIARRPQRRFAIWWLLTALTVVVLMWGTPISLNGAAVSRGPWIALRRLPLLDSVLPVRLSLMLLLLVAGLIAWTLGRLHGRALIVGVAVTAAVLVPLRPVLPQRPSTLPPTPQFFTTPAVNVLPQRATTVVFPTPAFPRTNAMIYQIRARLRFDLVGGYSVLKVSGRGTYFPHYPVWVEDLRRVGTGQELSPEQIRQAESSVAPSGITHLVVTRYQDHSEAVVAAAVEITGCVPEAVSDVVVCVLPLVPGRPG